MPFGMGFGELVLILVIVVVVFGRTRLPQLGADLENGVKRFRDALQNREPPRLLLQKREPRRWKLTDWLLVLAALALVVLVIANAVSRR
jgi:sec-independent protein translocase protein TatA